MHTSGLRVDNTCGNEDLLHAFHIHGVQKGYLLSFWLFLSLYHDHPQSLILSLRVCNATSIIIQCCKTNYCWVIQCECVRAHDSNMNTQPNVKPTKSVAKCFLATLVGSLSLILVIDLAAQFESTNFTNISKGHWHNRDTWNLEFRAVYAQVAVNVCDNRRRYGVTSSPFRLCVCVGGWVYVCVFVCQDSRFHVNITFQLFSVSLKAPTYINIINNYGIWELKTVIIWYDWDFYQDFFSVYIFI